MNDYEYINCLNTNWRDLIFQVISDYKYCSSNAPAVPFASHGGMCCRRRYKTGPGWTTHDPLPLPPWPSRAAAMSANDLGALGASEPSEASARNNALSEKYWNGVFREKKQKKRLFSIYSNMTAEWPAWPDRVETSSVFMCADKHIWLNWSFSWFYNYFTYYWWFAIMLIEFFSYVHICDFFNLNRRAFVYCSVLLQSYRHLCCAFLEGSHRRKRWRTVQEHRTE